MCERANNPAPNKYRYWHVQKAPRRDLELYATLLYQVLVYGGGVLEYPFFF